MSKKKSKNNPEVRNSNKTEIKNICEFCGTNSGVHRILYGNKFRWACKNDNCTRFK